MLYLKNFGLTHDPLGKAIPALVANSQMPKLKQHVDWLLQTKGVGVVIGESGVGKTSAVRHLLNEKNPMQYKIYYQSDNQFKPFDIYKQFANALGLKSCFRYADLWRELKVSLLDLYEEKKVVPVWVVDEMQDAPIDFLKSLPAFLNFSFDSKDVMVILLLGTQNLEHMLTRSVCQSLSSRIQFCFHWQPIESFEEFVRVIDEAFKNAGCASRIISEPGLKLLHLASKGRLRDADHFITLSLQKATDNNQNHLSDDIIQSAINTKFNSPKYS